MNKVKQFKYIFYFDFFRALPIVLFGQQRGRKKVSVSGTPPADSPVCWQIKTRLVSYVLAICQTARAHGQLAHKSKVIIK